MKPRHLYFTILILVVVIIFLLLDKFGMNITGMAIANEKNDDVINKLTELRTDLKNKEPVEIQKITLLNINKLKDEAPVIYKDTKPGDYLIKYENEWFAFDYENNRIIEEFVIQTISVS